MRGNLAVKIKDASGERVVTRTVTGLRFRKTANGGHADASCTINIPRSQFPTLGPADRLYVFDTTTADTIWDGYTNNPGTQTGRNGEGFEVSALGGMSLANDQAERLVYVDQQYDQWVRTPGSTPSGTFEATAHPDSANFPDTDALFEQFGTGQAIANSSTIGARYLGIRGSAMTVGGITGTREGGLTDANYQAEFAGGAGTINSANLNTTITRFRHVAGQTYDALFATGLDAVVLRLARRAGGATNVGTDNLWVAFNDLYILGHLVDRFGALRDMNLVSHIAAALPTSAYVLAHEVVEDLLGRIMTFCNPATAIIETTPTYQIDQFAYTSAVRAAQVLDDLGLYEPDYLWEILESEPTTGKHRFNYRAWPTTSRYVLPPSIVVEQPGGDVDLCNRIAVNWVDKNGDPQTTIRTTVVPELAGRTRDAEPITLPDKQGSQLNAERIGDQVLATKATPPRAGTAVVDRPIMDLLRGATVQPWEIEPGYLVQVVSTGDSIRLTETEYEDDSCSATLTMGDPVLTIEQRIAMLQQTDATPRRIRR